MQLSRKPLDLAGYIALAAVGFYCIFQLPFGFAATVPVVSDSYIFGFNNRVAVLSTVGIVAVLTLLRRYLKIADWLVLPLFGEKTASSQPLDRRWLVGFVLASTLATLAVYLFVHDGYFGESGYILKRMDLLLHYGRLPYKDFEFAYGPALLYLPAGFASALAGVGLALRPSYYLFFALTNALCLAALFFVVDQADIAKKHKALIFALVALAALPVFSLAINGWARHLTPYASVIALWVWSGKNSPSVAKLALLGAAASLLNLAISPEVGVAFSAALAFYLVVLSLTVHRRFILNLLVHLVSLPLFLWLISPDYLQSVFNFLGGDYNFPVVPALHILLYLLSFFVLLPNLIGGVLDRSRPDRPLVAGLIVLCLAMLPGALGRCDFWHVTLYGIGVFLLTLLGLAKASEQGRIPRLAFSGYALGYALILALVIRVFDVYPYRYLLANDLYAHAYTLLGPERSLALAGKRPALAAKLHSKFAQIAHAPDFSKLDPYGPMLAPVEVSAPLERYLKATGKFLPEYYPDNQGIYSDAQIARKLQDVESSPYVLVPAQPAVSGDFGRERQAYLSRYFLYPFRLPQVRDSLSLDERLQAYLTAHFHKITEVEGYVLLGRNNTSVT